MQISIAVLGCGNRGRAYTSIIATQPENFTVTAIADTDPIQLELMHNMYAIPQARDFTDIEEFMSEKRADTLIIATPDRTHVPLAIRAMELGYDVLLEKPVSPDPVECRQIADHAKEMGTKVVVCHVLRYTPFFSIIKEMIDSGKLGDVVSINHEEAVGNVHQSHSFVRGNWGNTARSAPMLLAKSCHDLDILQWLIGKKCKQIQSFGSLKHFREENAPAGAPQRCIDGCPHGETCPYNAVKLYLDDKENAWFREASTKESNPTDEMVEKALRNTLYGCCVYRCDNDVVDRQVVNLEFEGGAVATFTMIGLSSDFCRQLKIFGTEGQIEANMGTKQIVLHRFWEEKKTIPLDMGLEVSGHGGGDFGIMRDFLQVLRDGGVSKTSAEVSLQSHLICFAAERSRNEHTVITL